MKFILLLLILVSPVTFAQRSLNRDSFMANIRPVLNGILGDFYQMVTLFPDFPRELIPLLQEMDSLTSDKEIMKELCPALVSLKCKDQINALNKKLGDIRGLTLKLIEAQKMSSSWHINSLSGLRLITEFDLKLEAVKGTLGNASFLQAAGIQQRNETYTLLKELDELNTMLSLAVVEYIPFMYRDDFRHFYSNFIHPVQQQISKNKNYEFLNKNVTSLNFAINLLNMQLTKRKKTPEGMGPYLSTMHNRWNSILRYYW